jgi:Domain of unknown function (DUF6538)
MRAKTNPSYLIKSPLGIFYFRVRIPSSIKNQYNSPKIEIRKSLNTRDISVALKEARRWWVKMEQTDYTMKNDVYDEMDRVLLEESEGRKLLKQFLIATKNSENDSYFPNYDDTELDVFFHKLSSPQQRLFNQQLEIWNNLSQSEKDKVLEEIDTKLALVSAAISDRTTPIAENDDLANDLVSDKIDEYVTHYIERKKRTGKPAPLSTVNEYKGIYKEFLRMIGEDLRCCDLNKEVILDANMT